MVVDPTISKIKFDYKEECKMLKKIKLAKYKLDKGSLFDNPLNACLLED